MQCAKCCCQNTVTPHTSVDSVTFAPYLTRLHSTIWHPGFNLPRQQWSLLNRYRTEQGHCGACRRKWRDPDDVPHCRILSPDETEWWFISAALCGCRRCLVADQLLFMTCIREEEEVTSSLFLWLCLLYKTYSNALCAVRGL